MLSPQSARGALRAQRRRVRRLETSTLWRSEPGASSTYYAALDEASRRDCLLRGILSRSGKNRHRRIPMWGAPYEVV